MHFNERIQYLLLTDRLHVKSGLARGQGVTASEEIQGCASPPRRKILRKEKKIDLILRGFFIRRLRSSAANDGNDIDKDYYHDYDTYNNHDNSNYDIYNSNGNVYSSSCIMV